MSTALSILKAFSSLLADKFNILSLKYDKHSHDDKYSQKFIFMTDIPTERDDFFMYKLHQRKALRSFSLALLAASSLTLLGFASTAAAAAPPSAASSQPSPAGIIHGNILSGAMNKQGVAAYQAKDYEKALPFFREAARLGNMKAYRYLGRCYAYGCGQKKDIQQAFHCYQKAAELGDVTGTALLGHMYEKGLGTKVDYDKAMEIYQKSALRDDHVGGTGKIGIGHLYEYGHDVEQNVAEARVWYGKALQWRRYHRTGRYRRHCSSRAGAHSTARADPARFGRDKPRYRQRSDCH